MHELSPHFAVSVRIYSIFILDQDSYNPCSSDVDVLTCWVCSPAANINSLLWVTKLVGADFSNAARQRKRLHYFCAHADVSDKCACK